MKINRIALAIAVFYNLMNLIFWELIKSAQGGSSLGYAIIYPYFWALTGIILLVFAIKNRRSWFSRQYIFTTLICFIFCTPYPIVLFIVLHDHGAHPDSVEFFSENGHTIKYQVWTAGGRVILIKYWKADRENCEKCDSSMFQKDSTWVYYNNHHDTIKSETYQDGKLIKTVVK